MGEVYQLYRSSAETTVHAFITVSTTQSGFDERHEAEFWYSPFGNVRQVDADGLLSVDGPEGHWHRGPYAPDTWPERLLTIHRRWGSDNSLGDLIPASTDGISIDINGRRAWEFVLPPEFGFGDPLAVAFDDRTGIVLRAKSGDRTEELSELRRNESFSESTFALPDDLSNN